MAKVRARFKVTKYEASVLNRPKDPAQEYSAENSERVELATIVLSPVEPAADDSKHKNRQFWRGAANGEIRMVNVEPEVARQLVSGREFWIDFTPVE